MATAAGFEFASLRRLIFAPTRKSPTLLPL